MKTHTYADIKAKHDRNMYIFVALFFIVPITTWVVSSHFGFFDSFIAQIFPVVALHVIAFFLEII